MSHEKIFNELSFENMLDNTQEWSNLLNYLLKPHIKEKVDVVTDTDLDSTNSGVWIVMLPDVYEPEKTTEYYLGLDGENNIFVITRSIESAIQTAEGW